MTGGMAPAGAYCAKRTQFLRRSAKTPEARRVKQSRFRPERGSGQVLNGKRVMVSLVRKRHWQEHSQLAGKWPVWSFTFEAGKPRAVSCEPSDFELPTGRRAASVRTAPGCRGNRAKRSQLGGRARRGPVRCQGRRREQLYKRSQFADRDRDNRAKQSQLGRGDGKEHASFRKGVTANLTCPGPQRNKANFPRSGRCEGSGIHPRMVATLSDGATGAIGLQFRAVADNVMPH